MPVEVEVPGPRSIRRLVFGGSNTLSQFQGPWTGAYVPYTAISGALTEVGRFWAWAAHNVGGKWRFDLRQNAEYHVPAMDAVVQAKCFALNASLYTKEWNATSAILPFYEIGESYSNHTEHRLSLSIQNKWKQSQRAANSIVVFNSAAHLRQREPGSCCSDPCTTLLGVCLYR